MERDLNRTHLYTCVCLCLFVWCAIVWDFTNSILMDWYQNEINYLLRCLPSFIRVFFCLFVERLNRSNRTVNAIHCIVRNLWLYYLCVCACEFFSLAISLLDNNNLNVPRNVSGGGGVSCVFTVHKSKIVIHRNSYRQFKLDEREEEKKNKGDENRK